MTVSHWNNIAHYSMPMKLPQSSHGEMLLNSRDVPAGGQVGHQLFPNPTPRIDPCLGVREAPLEVWGYSVIRFLGAEIVGILEV